MNLRRYSHTLIIQLVPILGVSLSIAFEGVQLLSFEDNDAQHDHYSSGGVLGRDATRPSFDETDSLPAYLPAYPVPSTVFSTSLSRHKIGE